MIYLDSAATSLLKPERVYDAVLRAMRTMASPGRGGHAPAMRAAETAYRCREAAAELFHAPAPENVVFTFNATHGLNIAVRTLVSAGDRVVVSGWEHNAVTRALRLAGAQTDVVRTPLFDGEAALAEFARRVPGAKAVVCTHVSNVFGFILPVDGIAAICRDCGVPFVLDASQSAGALEVDMAALGARFVAMPGHKGLMGPQGTGLLLCGGGAEPLMAGGTGSDSRSQEMPDYLPDRLEAGTHNITGIAGLLAGIEYVRAQTPARIGAHERRLTALAAAELRKIPGLEVFAAEAPAAQAGVLSVRHGRAECEALAQALGARGVAVRAGLHCAPTAHETAGTLDTGTVRFSFSPFNTAAEVARAAEITRAAAKKLEPAAK